MEIFRILFIITLVLYVLFVLSFIFLEKRKENSLISWLLVFIIFPFIGFLIYLIFGRDMSKKKVFKLFKTEENLMEEIKHKAEHIYYMKKSNLYRVLKESIESMELTSRMSETGVHFNNKVEVFTDGKKKFDKLIEDIKNAENEIHILYFIYKKDELGKKIRDLLIEKAEQGVKVRLLLDHFGSFNSGGSFFKKLKDAGGKVSFSFPLSFKNFQLNNRNHRKIVIIDRKIAYIGGFNIGDEYLGDNPKSGYWRDTHIRIQGPGIIDLQVRFFLDWRNAGNDDIVIEKNLFLENNITGTVPIQILSSGPDSQLEKIKLAYIEMINNAKDFIFIQTPYFVPDETFVDAIRLALIKGVDVRIMIPNKQDHIFVYWATYSYIGDLLPLGLKAYTYENGFLHAKTILVDNKIASIGSANFDKRSFKLSFECNAFLYGRKFGEEMKAIFIEDMKFCEQLTLEKYNKRSLSIRIKEPISRIISPIL
ncbi:MAG: cardiolipin synthase [Firmicutes bacterium]|nr:cardiolipin synthase [Bacillota bacterium]